LDFAYSEKVEAYRARVQAFMDAHVYPNEETHRQQHAAMADRWQPIPIVDALKRKAQEEGLWNLFLPHSRYGAGLTN
jgi:acyl-CoA dehydrogenase